jgi:hypothetical protein
LEEVTVSVGHKVLMEVDDSISLIFGNPQGILNQQLRPCPIHILNIFTILIDNILFDYFKN